VWQRGKGLRIHLHIQWWVRWTVCPTSDFQFCEFAWRNMCCVPTEQLCWKTFIIPWQKCKCVHCFVNEKMILLIFVKWVAGGKIKAIYDLTHLLERKLIAAVSWSNDFCQLWYFGTRQRNIQKWEVAKIRRKTTIQNVKTNKEMRPNANITPE